MNPSVSEEIFGYLQEAVESEQLDVDDANALYQYAVESYDDEEYRECMIELTDVVETVMNALEIDPEIYEESEGDEILDDLKVQVFEAFSEDRISESDFQTMLEYLEVDNYTDDLYFVGATVESTDDESKLKAAIAAHNIACEAALVSGDGVKAYEEAGLLCEAFASLMGADDYPLEPQVSRRFVDDESGD